MVQPLRLILLRLLVLVVAIGAGCATIGVPGPSQTTQSIHAPTTESPTTSTADFTRRQPITENIDSALAGLIDAENRSQYAATHGLEYRGGRVLVVIELVPNGSIPAEYNLEVEHRVVVEDGVVVQAYLDVDAIGPLVREPAVRSIRVPESPSTVG